MELAVLSANLRRLRGAKGMTQGDLADAAGISRVGYRNIEGGTSAPKVDTLMRIAEALQVNLQVLVTPVRTLSAVRFRADKKMTTRTELLADVGRWLDNYNELEELLGDRRAYALAAEAKKIARLPRENRAQKAAISAREKMGLGDESSIRDICGLLEHHGIKVYTPQLASEGFFGLSVAERDRGPAVIVNTWERLSVERWIFTAAHELGHLLMHLDAYDVAKTDEDSEQEKEADAFASYFLMPEDLFNREYEESRGLSLVKRVFKLKRIFRVSWQSVLYRIAAKSSDRGAVWGRFQAEYKRMTTRTLGKTDEPQPLETAAFARPPAKVADEPEHLVSSDFIEDRLSRLVRRAIEESAISLGRAAEILDLDLIEMRDRANSWVE